MKNVINLKELRENVAKYATRVGRGESFIVMKRSKPLFRVCPIDDEKGWETVIDFTEIRKGGVPADEVLKKLRALA